MENNVVLIETDPVDTKQTEPVEQTTTPATDNEVDFAVKYNQDIFSMIGGYFHV